MSKLVNLSCDCGAVKGTLKVVPKSYFHVNCFCCDCQNFAAYLKHEDKMLDEHGATDLFQTYPANVTLSQGHDHIDCIKLSEKGIYRWYTRCCKTPLANTLQSATTPFVGIPVYLMRFDSEQDKQQALGPVVLKAFGKYAKGDMPQDAHIKYPVSFLFRMMAFMTKGILTRKANPSIFFKDGKPVASAKLVASH